MTVGISLPREHHGRLEGLLDELPADVFRADDSLGWVYQFWQAEKKDQVNKSGTKIGADELSAVTQLFTDDYMVLFLLHNTLGAWWARKVLAEGLELASEAESEDELRRACAVGNVTWHYLRFVREDDGPWRPAAGALDGWPEAAKDITVLDPCMGSGHFLVFALPILAAFRMDEEGLSRQAAVEAVLRDNLFGLEIDPRCTQIAAFYLALAAWRMIGHRPLPRLSLACSGLSLGVSKAEWLKLAERAAAAAPVPPERDLLGSRDNQYSARVKTGLERLYDLFARAPWLGSLIDPRRVGGDVFAAGFSDIEPFLAPLLSAHEGGDDIAEMAIAAQGMAKAAQILVRDYTLVATNVPYLRLRKQHEVLKEYCSNYFDKEKEDLAVVFISRIARLCKETTAAVVSPQNWFYQYRYRHFRKDVLKENCVKLVGRLGEGGFQSGEAAGAFAALSILDFRAPEASAVICSIDASEPRGRDKKDALLSAGLIQVAVQNSQLQNPDCRLSFETPSHLPYLRDFVITAQGIKTGDDSFWVHCYWELPTVESPWRTYQTSSEINKPYAGRSLIINWSTNGDGMVRPRLGSPVVGRRGVAASAMRQIAVTIYTGDLHYSLATPLVPIDDSNLPAVWAFCTSPDFNKLIREIEQNIAVTTDTFAKVPFDLKHWQQRATELFPQGIPTPHSDDPTQWLFDGHPQQAEAPLQVAVARLVGYRWPRQTGLSFLDCPALGPDDLEGHADADGVVCIPAVRGEEPAADRVGALLTTAFGTEWSPAKERQLIAATGSKADSLDEWLRTDFFTQHCGLFHHRPFVWHVWDGRKDGFHALVNYHKLAEGGGKGRRLLETLTYSYLGDWSGRQKAAVDQGVAGADGRLAAAVELQNELAKIIEGELPYDIFVRWKPMHGQPIGWEPDINDGVRLNIRPFMSATLSRGRTGAGVLRAKPNIKWQKDRGKEPERDSDDYPWFWNGEKFTCERHNDRHFTNVEKRAARQR